LLLVGAVKPLSDLIGGQLGGFIDGVIGSVSKAVYSKSKNIIDTGVEFLGQGLADIIAGGAVRALTYAEVQTKKKVLGVTTSNKVKTETSELDDLLLNQFSLVFESAGNALEKIAPVYGKDYANIISQLIIDPQKLSLKDLSGDELAKEIESFFSSTLDNWAGVLVGGTDVLLKYQQVGEGAFETVTRLAGQTLYFSEVAQKLGLGFSLAGVSAIDAVQNIANASGGFDALSGSLQVYAQNFFSDAEKTAAGMDSLSARLKELGVDTVPATREAFRELIEQQEFSTVAGQEQFAALVALSGAFAELVPATEAATSAVRSAIDIQREREGLEARYEQAIGNVTAIRARELSGLDDTNKAILEGIYAYEDAQDAQEKATQLMQARHDLDIQLLEAQGKTAEALAMRQQDALAQLDESLRPLQQSIWNAQAAAVAAAEAETNLAEATAKAAENANSLGGALLSLGDSALNSLRAAVDAERQKISDTVSRVSVAQAAVEAAVNAEKALIESAHSEKISALSAQADAEKTANAAIHSARMQSLEDEKSETQSRISGLTSLVGSLDSALGGLLQTTQTSELQSRANADAQIAAALSAAQQGDFGLAGNLGDAIKAATGTSAGAYASAEDYNFAQSVTANRLVSLSSLAGVQLTVEEKTLAILSAQLESAKSTGAETSSQFDALIEQANAQYNSDISQLDAITELTKNQADKLSGVNDAVLSVDDALALFNESLLAADFTNAQEEYARLDAILASSDQQLNALRGIETAVLSVGDALAQFKEAVAISAEVLPSLTVDQSQGANKTYAQLLDEIKALREESVALNKEIRASSKDAADTLYRIEAQGEV
jgi:hypothetical protein